MARSSTSTEPRGRVWGSTAFTTASTKRELVRRGLHGPEPGADRREDREPSHRPGVEALHGEPRDRPRAERSGSAMIGSGLGGHARRRAGRDRDRARRCCDGDRDAGRRRRSRVLRRRRRSRPRTTRSSKTSRAARSPSSGSSRSGHRDHPRSIAHRRLRLDENHVKVGSIASVGFGLTGMCIAAERGWQPREAISSARDDAPHLRRKAGAQERLVLSLAERPNRRARVAERGVLDRYRAAARRRAQRSPVLRQRSRDRAAGAGDLPPHRLRLDAQRPSDIALARLASRERDDRAPLGCLQRGVELYLLGLGSPTIPCRRRRGAPGSARR